MAGHRSAMLILEDDLVTICHEPSGFDRQHVADAMARSGAGLLAPPLSTPVAKSSSAVR
jgi:hypothetical protein